MCTKIELHIYLILITVIFPISMNVKICTTSIPMFISIYSNLFILDINLS